MNDEMTSTTDVHRRKTWRQFVETDDHRTDPSKLWRTIKAIDGKSPPKAENEAITFDDSQVSPPKQIANYFNRQFTILKLGRQTSSRETRLVSREIKQKSLMSAVTLNIVLNNLPPPINDEETLLSRRQRATISQLRSVHCKLLNSSKKRLKQTDVVVCHDQVRLQVSQGFRCRDS